MCVIVLFFQCFQCFSDSLDDELKSILHLHPAAHSARRPREMHLFRGDGTSRNTSCCDTFVAPDAHFFHVEKQSCSRLEIQGHLVWETILDNILNSMVYLFKNKYYNQVRVSSRLPCQTRAISSVKQTCCL